jgi:arylsulfatase A-like enzyme/thioredoxin-like negative regulator of GroEL
VPVGWKKGRPRRAGSRPPRRAARGLALLLGLVAGTSAACRPAQAPQRVVLVTIDTLRADHVGCYGAETAHTPALDALAARGARFETVISPAPLTLPSHTTLLTALDPPEHGVRHNGIFRLDDGVPTLAEAASAAGLHTAAFVGAFVLHHRFGLARGFETYDDRTDRDSTEGGILKGFAERAADEVADAALAWLETPAAADGRFLLWVHFYDAHAAYRPPPGWAAAFPGRPYAGEIAFVDAQLGRLLDAIEARWPDGRTLVAVTADHGESLGEHGEPTHSHSVYDATQRVPLILAGVGVPAGLVVARLVALRDVAPTLLDLAGAPPLEGASGRSLVPLLRGAEIAPRAAWMETLATQLDWSWSPLLALRTETHAYVRAPRPELYDVRADPRETHDLAAQEPGQVAALDAELEARLRGARPVQPSRTLSQDESAQLAALGYLVAPAPPGAALGRVGGVDPKDRMHVIAAVHEANGLVTKGEPEAAFARLEPLADEALMVKLLASGAALAAGRPERALELARACAADRPDSPFAYARIAAALEALERFDEAGAAWRAVLERDPTSAAARAALGLLAERAGDLAAARAQYEAGVAERAGGDAAWRLAALQIEAGETERAQSLLAELGVWAERGAAALRLARAEQKAGRPADAARRLEAAARAEPRDLAVAVALGDALAAAGRRGDAEAAYTRTLELVDPALAEGAGASPEALLRAYRAQALAGLGRRVEARGELEDALREPATLPLALREQARALAASLGSS